MLRRFRPAPRARAAATPAAARRAARRSLAALLALSAVWLGCRDNPFTPFLTPTGGKCVSDFKTIHLVGSFTSPAWNIPASPLMTFDEDCVLFAPVKFSAPGVYSFKFLTNGAFDTPPDFGGTEADTLAIGMEHPVKPVSGTGTGLTIRIPRVGCYEFKLMEERRVFRVDSVTCPPAEIHGTVAFDNVHQAPLPRARVRALKNGVETGADSSRATDGSYRVTGLAAGTYDLAFRASGYRDTTISNIRVADVPVGVDTVRLHSGCVTEFKSIQIVGDFTSPAWTISASPPMNVTGCDWSAVVDFTAGDHLFKFVTDRNFDTPPDFGGNESDTLRTGADNAVKRVTGQGTAIRLRIPVAGCYKIKLLEKDLLFRADAFGCSPGGIRGHVTFENVSQPPWPRVRVQALVNSAVAGTDSSSSGDGAFQISGLAAGTYSLAFRAFGYRDTTLAGIQVAETITDAGSVRLHPGCVSAFDSIQVVGDFTSPEWTISVSPQMQHLAGCKWQATATLSAKIHKFKLVTNGAFDNPPDYGGDETRVLHVDSTYAVRQVSGTGTSLTMDFPFSGEYVFDLDEEGRTLRVTPAHVSGDLQGILVFEGVLRPPLPVARVRLLANGAAVDSTISSSGDGTFVFSKIDQGRYDVRVEPPLPAPAHLDTTIAGVSISGGVMNLGQVFLGRAPGGVRGDVQFADVAAGPFPIASVELRRGGILAATARTSSSSASYLAAGLKPATYSVHVTATAYTDTTFTADIGRSVQTLGSVGLRRLVCASYPGIEALQILGKERNNSPSDTTFSWNLGKMPFMTHATPCGWEVSILAFWAAEYRIRFITNQDFGGDPPDFGGDDTTVYPPDSTVAVRPVSPEAGPTAEAILIRIPAPGVFRFHLDLEAMTFSFTRTGDLPAAAVRRAAMLRRRTRAARSAPLLDRSR